MENKGVIDALKKVLRKREKAKLAMVSKTLRECIDGKGNIGEETKRKMRESRVLKVGKVARRHMKEDKWELGEL